MKNKVGIFCFSSNQYVVRRVWHVVEFC